MARRVSTAEVPPEHPGWVSPFVAADWADPADDEHEMVGWCGLARTREILASGRWSDARSAYAAEVGLRLRDLPNSWRRR